MKPPLTPSPSQGAQATTARGRAPACISLRAARALTSSVGPSQTFRRTDGLPPTPSSPSLRKPSPSYPNMDRIKPRPHNAIPGLQFVRLIDQLLISNGALRIPHRPKDRAHRPSDALRALTRPVHRHDRHAHHPQTPRCTSPR